MQYERSGASFTARMEANGRIVIPARVRESLGLVAGSQLSLSIEGDSLVLRSKAARVRQVRERLVAQQAAREAAGAPSAGHVVEEFLAERRAEEARRRERLEAMFPDRVTGGAQSTHDRHDPRD